MKQSDQKICRKMIGYCDDITDMVQNYGNTMGDYLRSKPYQYATGMCILQIGELVNRLSPEAMAENVQIPWRLIRAMRNMYAHDYENVQYSLVWQTITEDIPALREQLQAIIDKGAEPNE